MAKNNSKYKINRLNVAGIISEYIHVPDSNKAIVLLDGLPSVPYAKDLMQDLANLGYSVFYPRYKGTWESDGEFLKRNPALDIDELIENLVGGIELQSESIIFNEINIIASSFGGSVALCLKDHSQLNKIIALSPVYDYPSIESLNTLSSYIRNVFTAAYRYSDVNWQKLLDGELINPSANLSKYDFTKKITVFAGTDDHQVELLPLVQFCKGNSISVIEIRDVGHISFSKIEGAIWDDIILCLSS